MAKASKLDLRARYTRELMKSTTFMGYKVTESGVVFNSKGRLVKPKFYMRGKKIDYVYIDTTFNGVKRRISYHRFIYMAWNKDFVDDPNMVVATIGRRFDYCIRNLKCITKEEHLQELAKLHASYNDDEIKSIVETYKEVKEYMTKTEFAKRLQVSVRTLNKYLGSTQ